MTSTGSQSNSGERTFELGLVMAGAVSAGAYTGGVVDFLIQALDAWQKAAENGTPDCPPHQVKIKVLAGASAGGMTGALLAAALNGDMSPVTQVPPPGPVNNKLYESWVEKIDIRPLLGKRDLADGTIKSLLDSTVLDDIAEEAFNIQPVNLSRRYIDDELTLYLSLSNIRGVPYRISFGGQKDIGHWLSLHADYVQFVMSKDRREPEKGLWLNPQDLTDPGWQHLKKAALATGAFPIGLAPRLLTRQARDYNRRRWPIPLAGGIASEGEIKCQDLQQIPPYWPEQMQLDPDGTFDYDFLCVDGGLMNNEPLELARRHLAGEEGYNPRRASEARRAVLLIDPFPNYAPFTSTYEPKDDILRVASGMFNSLRYQAQFKLDELVLVKDDEVFSRFLIAPRRNDEAGQPALYALACGALNAFGGFLSADFRRHDFQLGRRNCQQFLRKYFSLPEAAENPLFDGWTEAMKDKYRVHLDGEAHLPIVPLMDPVAAEVESLPWPRMTAAELAALRPLIDARARVLGGLLIDRYITGIMDYIARFIWWQKRGQVVNSIMNYIQADLEKRELMDPL